MPVSRRSGALAALLLCTALAVSACSAAEPEDAEKSPATDASTDVSAEEQETTEESLLPPAEGKTTYPITLETEWGSTELTERPKHIAAVTPSQDDVEILAAIGVTPYLASEFATDVWVENALTTPIPERFTRADDPIPVEQIAAAEPDLIVVLNTDLQAEYDKLAAIAPVLSISQAAGSESTIANDWAGNILRIGEVLDLSDAAQQALDTEEKFFEDFRSEHPELEGLTASYVVYYGEQGGLQFHSSEGSPAESTLEQMGFAPNPKASELEYRQVISEELVPEIDADVLIFSGNSNGNDDVIIDQPLFQGLGAVQNEHFIFIDNQDGTFIIDGVERDGNLPWALARSGPLSSTWAASVFADALTNTLAE